MPPFSSKQAATGSVTSGSCATSSMRNPSCVSNDLERPRRASLAGTGLRNSASDSPRSVGRRRATSAAALPAAVVGRRPARRAAHVQQDLARAAEVFDRHAFSPRHVAGLVIGDLLVEPRQQPIDVGLRDRAACRSDRRTRDWCALRRRRCRWATWKTRGPRSSSIRSTQRALRAPAPGSRPAWAAPSASCDHAAVDDQLHVGHRRRLAVDRRRAP